MLNLYITEQGAYVKVKLNQLIIEKEKIILDEIPIKSIESISVVGNVFLTTQAMSQLVKIKIPINYISLNGIYKFSIRGDNNVNISRQELQFNAFQNEKFCLNLSKKIIYNKAKNQLLVLRRYNRNENSLKIEKNIMQIKRNMRLIFLASSKQELLGIEGIIAKHYFDSFRYLLPKEIKFKTRVSYPPKDPFNALLSFGYTLLLNNFIVSLENKKLNPYKGFLHANKIGHPALASDLMEEYRPILVDTLILNLVRRNIIKVTDFYESEKDDRYYINIDKIKIVISKYNEKINAKKKYIINYFTDTKNVIYLQISSLIEALSSLDENLYFSVIYR